MSKKRNRTSPKKSASSASSNKKKKSNPNPNGNVAATQVATLPTNHYQSFLKEFQVLGSEIQELKDLVISLKEDVKATLTMVKVKKESPLSSMPPSGSRRPLLKSCKYWFEEGAGGKGKQRVYHATQWREGGNDERSKYVTYILKNLSSFQNLPLWKGPSTLADADPQGKAQAIASYLDTFIQANKEQWTNDGNVVVLNLEE